MTTATTIPSETEDVSRSWFSKLLRWLVPTRVDGLVVLCCSIVAIGLLDPFIDQQLFLYRTVPTLGVGKLGLGMGFCASFLAAIAVAWGWRKLDPRFSIAIVIFCAISLTGFLWSYFEVMRSWEVNDGIYQRYVPPFEKRMLENDSVLNFVLQRVGVAGACFAVLFIVTRGFLLLIERLIANSGDRKGLSRTQILIGTAIVLFVANFVQNQFFPMGFLYSFKAYGSSGLIGRFAIGATAFLVLFLMPSWILTSSSKSRWKIMTLVVLAIAYITAYKIRVNVTQPRFDFKVFTLVNGFVVFSFYFVLLCVSKNDQNQDAGSRGLTGLSIWSMFPVAVLIGVGYAVYFLDSTTLTYSAAFEWPNVNYQAARVTKSISRKSNYQIGIIGRYGSRSLSANMNETNDASIFENMNVNFVHAIDLSNLKPDMDVSNLYGCDMVSLKNCRVSSEQLNGLAQSATRIAIKEVEVVDLVGGVSFLDNADVFLSFNQKGSFAQFVDAVGSTGNNNPIVGVRLKGDALSESDADALVRLSQLMPVYVNNQSFGLLSKNIDGDSRQSLGNIVAPLGPHEISYVTCPKIGSPSFRFLLESNIFVVDGTKQFKGQDFWDFSFAKNVEAQPSYWDADVTDCFLDRSTFLKNSTSKHWNFSDDLATSKKLFLPGMDKLLSSSPSSKGFELMSDVEVLGLDPMWLSSSDPRTDRLRKVLGRYYSHGYDFESIDKLTNLKRLDLNSDVVISDVTFLTRIPTIEELQIRFDAGIANQVDFRLCRKLKKLVYFGVPDTTMISQLRTLKGLDSLTIVFDQSITSKTNLESLNYTIPGASIQFVSEDDFLPTPPVEFLKHVAKRSAEIRKRWGVAPQSLK